MHVYTTTLNPAQEQAFATLQQNAGQVVDISNVWVLPDPAGEHPHPVQPSSASTLARYGQRGADVRRSYSTVPYFLELGAEATIDAADEAPWLTEPYLCKGLKAGNLPPAAWCLPAHRIQIGVDLLSTHRRNSASTHWQLHQYPYWRLSCHYRHNRCQCSQQCQQQQQQQSTTTAQVPGFVCCCNR